MPVQERDLPPTNEEGEIPIPSGGSLHPDLFADMEETLRKDTEDEERRRNRFNVKGDDPITPFTTAGSFTVNDIAGARHQVRSRHARTADESFNAPVAPDYQTWRRHPDRYDLPGVDTIPDERLRERAGGFLSEAQRAGAVQEFREGDEAITIGDRFRGQFSGAGKVVALRPEEKLMEESLPSMRPGPVLAHEVGHAVDFEAAPADVEANPTGFAFASEVEAHRENIGAAIDLARRKERGEIDIAGRGAEEELLTELRSLSVRARGEFDSDEDEYRASLKEVMADALGVYRLEPRAVKREAPRAASFLADLEERALGDV